MFGGQGVNGRVNEARIFDFEGRVRSWDSDSCNSIHTFNTLQKWSKAITPLSPDDPWPSPTRYTFTC